MGLAVAPNAHHTLGALYGKILRTLQKMPDNSSYKKYTEQIVRERAAVLQQVGCRIFNPREIVIFEELLCAM